MIAPRRLKRYFNKISKECDTFYKKAQDAKKNHPKDNIVHTKIANTMAERVVGLLSSIYPEIVHTDIVRRIQAYEKRYGFLDWRVAFSIALEVAQKKHLPFDSEKEAILCGVRVGFAYITSGIVSSPLEGLVDIEIVDRRDGKGKFFRLSYGGPIRNAGGTAAAVSVLIADYVREKLGYALYDPDESEIKRFSEETRLYNTEVTNLQYLPSFEEIEFFVKKMPVEIAGDPTHKQEAKEYRDLPRIKTNRIRSGMCLIIAECLLLKAPKLLKGLTQIEFGMEDWSFLKDFCVLQKEMRAKHQNATKGNVLAPDFTFIKDLTMGRPVFSFPSTNGGFRLRYGRSRFTGFSAAGVHPATMILCDGFLAAGTQLRVERPLKSTITMPCDHIMGPIVRLKDGSVESIESKKDAIRVKNNIDEILFLGDMLISYGDFLDRGHVLIPCGYCEEWWFEEFKEAVGDKIKDVDVLQKELKISKDFFKQLIQDPIKSKMTPGIALRLSSFLHIPLHPKFTYFWSLLSLKEVKQLFTVFSLGRLENERFVVGSNCKSILEKLGISHIVRKDVVIGKEDTKILFAMFGITKVGEFSSLKINGEDSFDVINNLSKVIIRDKKGTFIGARMGRPEKAKVRHQSGAVHGLADYTKDKDSLQQFISQLPNAQTQHIKGNKGNEIWQKGAIRAQFDLTVNKDGTLRYDATEAPVTHFRATEAGVSFRDLKKLGYKKDMHGNDLISDEQIVEIFPQDVLLPCCSETKEEQCDDFLFSASQFVDTELKKIYDKDSVYNLKSKKNLLGQLLVGLAPHTSSGCIMRVVGFTKTQTYLCHPYMHAAVRRDCDGDESCFLLLMDVLLNFNPMFLPDRRGSKMDAPFVITPILEPKEVDDMMFNLDIVQSYGLDFYKSALAMKQPWDVKVKTIRDVLDTEDQYDEVLFTHENGSLNDAVMVSLYKKLENMKQLVDAQLSLAQKISAADENKVASLVLRRHVLKDITKNLSRFFIQEFRCTSCKNKLRRPTMNAQCPRCGGNVVPTVYIASVVKYKDILIELSEKYKLEEDVREDVENLLLCLTSLHL